MTNVDAYVRRSDGIYTPPRGVEHRDDEYDPSGFAVLSAMQQRHFWYRGRHRFLWYALRRAMRRLPRGAGLHGIDLGGGCGGWIAYLKRRSPDLFQELALADSSVEALTLAGGVLDADVRRYQIDLLDLQWQQRWDVAFLLDVLEHIPQDLQVLREAREALRLGGLLFVTVPALKCFWTYNDECAHHVRRYSRADFARLAEGSGMELCYTRYFMFFLSPLLLLSRWFGPDVKKMDQRQLKQHLAQTHRVPSWPVNALLGGIFAAETPLGLWCPFPWGTSVLAVMRRPHD